eukprot:snap_masked-scaffold_18-processed-gene-1.29-mRNA-1 protein AED:1.00 eAED:1.00 QI:0/0/0/0/1/1/2/0/68
MIKHLAVAYSGIAAADVALHRSLFIKKQVKRIVTKATEGVDSKKNNNFKKEFTCGKKCLEGDRRFDLN